MLSWSMAVHTPYPASVVTTLTYKFGGTKILLSTIMLGIKLPK